MGLNPLHLTCPRCPRWWERRRNAAALQLERQMAESALEQTRVRQLARAYSAARRYAAASANPLRTDFPAMRTTYQVDIFRHLPQLSRRKQGDGEEQPAHETFPRSRAA